MNKFTRSQMGKIMAYALSAAMAVTVVPTYMMKPLVAEAAVVNKTATVKAKTTYTISTDVTAKKNILLYVATKNTLTANTTNVKDTKIDDSSNVKVIKATSTDYDGSTNTTVTVDTAAYEAAVKALGGSTAVDCFCAAYDDADVLSTTVSSATVTSNYEITVPDDVATVSSTAKVYVETASDLAGTAATSLTETGTATVSNDGKTISVEKTAVDNKVTTADTYYVYYDYNKGGSATGTTLVSAGTITGQAGSVETIQDEKGSNKSTFYTGDKITITLPNDDAPNAGVVGLFTKTGTQTKSQAAYLFDAETNDIGFSVSTTTNPATSGDTRTISFYIPSSVEAGAYYVGVFNKDKIANVGKNEAATVLEADDLIDIKSDTIATGIALSSEKSTISFGEDTASNKVSNSEKLTTTLKGGSKYSSVSYKFTQYKADGSVDTGNTLFTVSGGNTNNTYTDSKELPEFTVTGTAAVEDGATLVCEVEMYVAGRVNPYKRSYTFTAKKDLNLVTGITFTNDEYIEAGKSTVVATNKIPASSNETLTYTFTSGTLATDSVGTVRYVFADKNGNGKYNAGTDTLYATFDEATGEVVTKKAGEYTITATGKNTGVSKTTTVTALEFKFATSGLVVDTNNGALSNKVVATPALDNTKGYVTYTVEDPSIATINNSTVAYGTALTANALSTGITKVAADITVYGSTKTYNFSKDGYIVVAPKATDKEFELTSVPNTEAYINGLKSTNNFYSGLKLQAAEAILAGEVDASRLSFEAYEDISNAAAIEYSGYYDIYNSSVTTATGTNEAVGLVLAAADPDVLNEDDPSKPVTVRYTVSDLQEKDKVYKQKDSVVDFVSEMTVDGEVAELKQPIWLKVTDSNIEDGSTYTVYDDGEAIYTAVAKGNTLTFQTDSFSVFSIVETPGATVTDNTSKVEEPDETDDIYDRVNFSAHVQRRIGTDDEADIAATVSDDGIISLGTHGQSRRVEKITLTGLDADEVEMTAHVQKRVDHPEDVADLTQVVNEDGSISIGTEHQSRRIEAFSMNLKGDLAEKYDVYYRVHAQNYGWLGWAKNGEIAGTSGHSFRLEGIEIIFVEKGTEFDESQYVKTPEEGDRGYSEKAAYMDRVVSEK